MLQFPLSLLSLIHSELENFFVSTSYLWSRTTDRQTLNDQQWEYTTHVNVNIDRWQLETKALTAFDWYYANVYYVQTNVSFCLQLSPVFLFLPHLFLIPWLDGLIPYVVLCRKVIVNWEHSHWSNAKKKIRNNLPLWLKSSRGSSKNTFPLRPRTQYTPVSRQK